MFRSDNREFFSVEPIAKLLCPEKSMILRSFKRASELARFTSTNPTPGGLGKESELKWPQKGDFNGQMSFAIGSVVENIEPSYIVSVSSVLLW